MSQSFRRVVHKKLGEILIENKIITKEQLDEALALQNKRKNGLIGEILVELGFATEEDIANTLATQYGFPYLPLANYDINADIVGLLPSNVAKQYCLIPVDKMSNTVVIAIANPLNEQALEDVEFVTGCDVKVFISTSSDIRHAIKRYYK